MTTNQETIEDSPVFRVTSQTTHRLVFERATSQGIKLEYMLCLHCGVTSRQKPVGRLSCTNCERVYPSKADIEWFNKGRAEPADPNDIRVAP